MPSAYWNAGLPSGSPSLLVVSLAVADRRYSLSRYVSSLRHAHTGKRRYQSYCQNLFSSLFHPELN